MNSPQSLIQRASTQVPTQVPFVPFVFTFLPRQTAEPPLSPGSLLHALNCFNMSEYMSDEHVLGTPGAPPCRAKPLNIHSPPGPCYMCYMRYILHAKPPNIHSPPRPCYMCYMCYILHAEPRNIHSPPGPCYMCYMCYILHAKPRNLHSPPGPCYMCYMCYILHAKPLNPHSSPAPCYMYYMCYIFCTRENL